jgi:hypothetical protein
MSGERVAGRLSVGETQNLAPVVAWSRRCTSSVLLLVRSSWTGHPSSFASL